MAPVIRIPESLYKRLEKHATGFDNPANMIGRLLDHYEQSQSNDLGQKEGQKQTITEAQTSNNKFRTSGNSVSEWKRAIEIALGFAEGSTPLDGNAPLIRNIYKKFCRGEDAFGVSGVNPMEALFKVIKEQEPDKYDLALAGLKKSIEQSDKPFHKMRKLHDRISQDS